MQSTSSTRGVATCITRDISQISVLLNRSQPGFSSITSIQIHCRAAVQKGAICAERHQHQWSMLRKTVKDTLIIDCFLKVENSSDGREILNEWVPTMYWTFLVNQALDSDKAIKESKLRWALELRSRRILN